MNVLCKYRLRSPGRPNGERSAAFTLVEVALALGIMGFSFAAIFGLVPIGLSTARKASETSVRSEIVQRVVGDLKQTDFNALTSETMGFDDQANLLVTSTTNTSVATSAPGKIYDVQVLLHSVSLPGATAANPNLARVQITVANNPGNTSNPFTSGSSSSATPLPPKVYAAYVARSTAGNMTSLVLPP